MALTWGPSNTWMSFTETTFGITITSVTIMGMGAVSKTWSMVHVMDVVHWERLCHHCYQSRRNHQALIQVRSIKEYMMVAVEQIYQLSITETTFVLSWLKCEAIIERMKSTSTWAAIGQFLHQYLMVWPYFITSYSSRAVTSWLYFSNTSSKSQKNFSISECKSYWNQFSIDKLFFQEKFNLYVNQLKKRKTGFIYLV